MPTETRNTQHTTPRLASKPQGVGGRQQSAHPPPQGGGYLPICNASGAPLPARAAAATDRRLAELREMGLHPVWIVVAATIGWEAWVRQWEVFDANAELLDGRNRITLPSFETYRRFQYNESIRTLLRAGLSAEDVREKMQQIHGARARAARDDAMLLREFLEEGRSAFIEANRRQFEAAIDYAVTHQVDIFYTWSSSRFARNKFEAAKFKRDLERAGVKLFRNFVNFIPRKF